LGSMEIFQERSAPSRDGMRATRDGQFNILRAVLRTAGTRPALPGPAARHIARSFPLQSAPWFRTALTPVDHRNKQQTVPHPGTLRVRGRTHSPGPAHPPLVCSDTILDNLLRIFGKPEQAINYRRIMHLRVTAAAVRLTIDLSAQRRTGRGPCRT